MSGYHVEHGIKDDQQQQRQQQQQQQRRRPDLSTFFRTLDIVDTSGSRQPSNPHALAHPTDISAAYRTLANAFAMVRGGGGGNTATVPATAEEDPHSDLMASLIESLISTAEHPPTKVEGVSDEFIAQLERVEKKELQRRPDGSCPICSNAFLDDKYPLVVRLPCHEDHLFDLECIEPWLKLNPTCPLDRRELVGKTKKMVDVSKVEDDEEEEYDDMYS